MKFFYKFSTHYLILIFAISAMLNSCDIWNTSNNSGLPIQTLDWNKRHTLKISDFRAEKPDSSGFEAYTSTKFSYSRDIYRDKAGIYARVEFNKYLSWYSGKNKDLLSHEEGHFHITEISRRDWNRHMLARKIADENDFKKQFEEGLAYRIKFADSLNALYDAETDHGMSPLIQLGWEMKFDKMLKDLTAFKENYIMLKYTK